MGYRDGDWYVFCDICGQRCWASESTKLSTYTGRGGLIVCKHDADEIDPGTLPFRHSSEKNIPWTRINHTDTHIGSPYIDLEEMAYAYYLTSSQDNVVLTPSQSPDEGLSIYEPI